MKNESMTFDISSSFSLFFFVLSNCLMSYLECRYIKRRQSTWLSWILVFLALRIHCHILMISEWPFLAATWSGDTSTRFGWESTFHTFMLVCSLSWLKFAFYVFSFVILLFFKDIYDVFLTHILYLLVMNTWYVCL